MSVIRDLVAECGGLFLNGKFDSVSLFQGEMAVSIFAEDGASVEDAVRCIEHYNGLSEKADVMDEIQKGLVKFFLYMFDEWKDFEGVYGDIVEALKPVMEGYQQGRQLVTFLSRPVLYVYPQRENEIGYGIECDCPWEPEHQCCILIRNDQVLYVGPSEGLDPWGSEADYYCIWE